MAKKSTTTSKPMKDLKATKATKDTRDTKATQAPQTTSPAATARQAVTPPRTYAPMIVSKGHTPTHEEIAKRAYELFERRGHEHGHHLRDWLAAEAELRAGTAAYR